MQLFMLYTYNYPFEHKPFGKVRRSLIPLPPPRASPMTARQGNNKNYKCFENVSNEGVEGSV